MVAALRAAGCSVISLAKLGAGIPDLCVATPKAETWLIEVKNPKTYGKLNDEQKAFMASWQGKMAVVETAEQAIALVTA